MCVVLSYNFYYSKVIVETTACGNHSLWKPQLVEGISENEQVAVLVVYGAIINLDNSKHLLQDFIHNKEFS